MSNTYNKSPFKPGASVITYLRDSGHEDQELSVEQQEAAVRYYCNQNGIILEQIYKDAARPGETTIGRNQFLDMIQHFRDSTCTASGLIIWKLSRFARDIDDSQFYKSDLRRRGYTVHSMTDSIPDGLEGRFVEAAIDWMNAKYVQDLSVDIKRGQSHNLATYGAIGGRPPVGFITETAVISKRRDGSPHNVQRWVPDPNMKYRIQQAFEMRAAGESYADINKALGLYKSTNTYNTFFSNRIYIGELVFGGQVIMDYCQPIIDPETWAAVQKIQQEAHGRVKAGPENPDHPRRKSSSYILSGIAYCSRCGAALNGDTVQFKQTAGYRYEYYACSGQNRHNGCDARKIPAEALENAVLETLTDYILSPNLIAEHNKLLEQETLTFQQRLAEQRSDLSHRLSGIRQQINHLNDVLSSLGTTAPRSTITRIVDLEREETTVLTQIAELKNTVPTQFTSEELQQRAARVREVLGRIGEDETNKILRGLIYRVTAELDYDAKKVYALITYYYPPTESETRPSNDGPASDFMPMAQCPKRDTEHTHKFTVSITIQYSGRGKRFTTTITDHSLPYIK